MRKNFAYYLSPSVLTGLVSLFVVIPVSTYYLDPKDFGIIAIITVFSKLVVPLSSTGANWVLSGNYYRISQQEKGELIFNLLFSGMLLRAFWALLFGVTAHSFLPKVIKSYQPAFLSYFFIFLLAEWFNYSWEIVANAIRLQKKGKVHALLDITKVVSNVAVLIICLVMLRLNTVSLALAYLGTAIGGFLFSMIYIRKYLVVKIEPRWLKEIARVGLPTIPLNLFEVISDSIGQFFTERWIGLSRLGIYNHSLYYKKAFMLPHRAFQKAYSPDVLKVFSDKEAGDIKFGRNRLKKWLGILTLSGAAIALFAEEVINILTHGKFIQAAPLVSLWFLIIIIYAFGVPYSQFLLAHKKNKFLFWNGIITGLFSWAIIAFSVKFFGITGAVVSVLLYFFLIHFSRKIYAQKLGCENFEGYYFIFSLAILLSLIYIVYTFDIALIPKFVILFVLGFLVIKIYDLYSLLKSRTVKL